MATDAPPQYGQPVPMQTYGQPQPMQGQPGVFVAQPVMAVAMPVGQQQGTVEDCGTRCSRVYWGPSYMKMFTVLATILAIVGIILIASVSPKCNSDCVESTCPAPNGNTYDCTCLSRGVCESKVLKGPQVAAGAVLLPIGVIAILVLSCVVCCDCCKGSCRDR